VRIAKSLMTRCGLAAIAMVLAGWFLQWPAPGAAARGGAVTFVVNSTADSHDAHPGNGKCADSAGRCTLRAAVEAANAEPAGTPVTITVPSGRYGLTLGSLDLTGNTISITGMGSGAIAGAAAGSTVIQAKGTFRVVRVGAAAAAVLAEVTISGGNAGNSGYGGGVYNAGKLTISGSVISGNTAVAGGGVANAGGTLNVTQTTVTRNHAPYYGGGGIQNGGLGNVPGLVTVTDSTVSGNSSGGDGGGILNGQNGHPASAHRAAVRVRPGCRPVRHCAAGPGRAGAGRPPGPGLRLVVTGTQVTSNTSSNAGGGIANDGGVATVTGSMLTGNSAGGGIGGGIEDYGSLTVRLSTLDANRAASGGGIETYDGHVAVPSTATIEQSTIDGNKAEVGGGIDDSNTVTVTASTLAANRAGHGGGVEVEGNSRIGVLNSTFTGNVGSGIQTFQCGTGSVRYATFDGNDSALSLSCSDLQLTGTIVSGSTAGANCAGAAPTETVGYNLDSGTSCAFAKSTDLTKANPRLGTLADNGGPTMTETLRHGSPAINHGGTPATGCPPADQRGISRPFGPACDIGAVEVRHT
jgi:CSLREA domain-containing protein